MAENSTNIYTGTTRFDKTLQTLIRLQLEEQLRSPLAFLNCGYIPARFVKGSNGTMRFLAVGDLDVDVSDSSASWVVTEGEPNASEDLDFGFEEFSTNQLMRTVKVTDVAAMESPLNLYEIAGEKLARFLLEFQNATLARYVVAGANKYFVGADATPLDIEVAPADVLTGADIRAAVAELEATNVPTFGDQSYRAFIHPYVKLDLSGDDDAGGWIDARRYAKPVDLITGELGEYNGVRFIKSVVGHKIANAGSSSNDVYVTPIMGPGAVAFGDFNDPETFFTPPGGHSDPGHQSALATVKAWAGAFIVGAGTSAAGPVSAARYINVHSGASKSQS